MSVNANQEQRLAIEHRGGVLLSAGAGSGKTFVLKEHFLYLCDQWIQEFIENPILEFETFIKSKMRKVVFMTFTNKAAGELEIRIKKAVDLRLETVEEDKAKLWSHIKKNIDFMTIGTIHGFCLKLIRQGFFVDIPVEINIKSENEFKKFLFDQLDHWLLNQQSQKLGFEKQLILKNKNKVADALFMIFSDAMIRKSWVESTPETLFSDEAVEETYTELFRELNFDHIWEKPLTLGEIQEFSGKKWQGFLDEFLPFIAKKPEVDEMVNFFAEREYKIPVKPSGKTIPSKVISYYESVRDLKDWLKKNGESILNFNQQKDSTVKKWYKVLLDLVLVIEKNYFKLEGVTFADLEYLVANALSNTEVVSKIAQEYEYFVIDEFQDTSQIQFSIIETIIKKDYQRLFCVGDPKQAIYGFRGGELGVFLNCMEQISKNLSLRNNYRSLENIITYNNLFFDFLFEQGPGFKGIDNHTVEVLSQEVPFAADEKGSINELICSLESFDGEEKLSNFQLENLEALTILEKIKMLRNKDENCAVLYKRLKPSYLLIDQLIKNNMSFTAQVKIPFLEDPINGIFYVLCTHLRDQSSQKNQYIVYLLSMYRQIISRNPSLSIDYHFIEKFLKNEKFFGLYYSFCKFLEDIDISNSNFSQNLKVIEAANKACDYDVDKLILYFERLKENSYSLDFQYGDSPESITIMTAHASKGLQFAHVIIGGVYTNGLTMPNRGPIGKFPGSFKWSSKLQGKKQYKTPSFLLEEIIQKQKEFSESKRLFYVTNTRAEKSLSYVKFDFGKVKVSRSQADAWVNGINKWVLGDQVQIEREELTPNTVGTSIDTLNISQNRPPFFHQDELGVSVDVVKKETYLLPELSVTRLASLSLCPKKFYLENVCKISEDELTGLSELLPRVDLVKRSNSDQLSLPNISSIERGTELHYEISMQVLTGFKNIVECSSDILWVVEKLKQNLENFHLVSEKQIKFDLFSYMISGIPDLVLFPKNTTQLCEIWDFKTGRLKQQDQEAYNFQLLCYAYAMYELGKVSKEKQINLVLCYIDEEQLVEQKVSFNDVENSLSRVLLDINNPDRENLKHCDSCIYKLICQK